MGIITQDANVFYTPNFDEQMKTYFEDIKQAFEIKEDLYEKYVEKEILKDVKLSALAQLRREGVVWAEEAPYGSPGTYLNAIVLYALIRHYKMEKILETGISGGYFSAFIIGALIKNGGGRLTSIEIETDSKEIGKMVPRHFLLSNVHWEVYLGEDAAKFLNHIDINIFDLFCHDSLHTFEHMLKEFTRFKQCNKDCFFIYMDDQNTDDFWLKSYKTGWFIKPRWKFTGIDGNGTSIPGHLGGFLKYEKKKEDD